MGQAHAAVSIDMLVHKTHWQCSNTLSATFWLRNATSCCLFVRTLSLHLCLQARWIQCRASWATALGLSEYSRQHSSFSDSNEDQVWCLCTWCLSAKGWSCMALQPSPKKKIEFQITYKLCGKGLTKSLSGLTMSSPACKESCRRRG